MIVSRSFSLFICILLLVSCGKNGQENSQVHFALNEATNTVTGMTTSKIEIAPSLEDCETIRKNSLNGIAQQEYFEVINSVCVAGLPGRLIKPFEGNPRHLDVVVKYVREKIRTTEIFYLVDESWSDEHACEFVKGLFARLASDPACYSHQVAQDIFDGVTSESMLPTIEIVTLENEKRALSRDGGGHPN